MIDPRALLRDLQQLVKRLEADLCERAGSVADVEATLREEYAAARQASRTAGAYEVWRDDYLTQVAVAWVLGCVFVRFLEDNALIDAARLAGAGERLRQAKDHHILYFQGHPHDSDREYLLAVFHEVAQLPAAAEVFDRRHHLIWKIGISGDAATALLDFWQRIDPASGRLVHDFTAAPQEDSGRMAPRTDPHAHPGHEESGSRRVQVPPAYEAIGQGEVLPTRFLGDLYQDLSEAARKKYALLQTPGFIEEFILDRTLAPAIDEFGYREVRMIDPACGSGHFLLGGFRRLFALWVKHEPGTNPRQLAQRALDQVYGVDLNPYAAAIARFRLLIAALQACGIRRLRDAPGFRINVAAGDSLLHGPNFSATTGAQLSLDPADTIKHVYLSEDRHELARILGQRYHVVAGNPPYITVKDKALNQAYRDRYESCHRQYSLAVPFMQRFFELALPASGGRPGAPSPASLAGEGGAGYAGMITANSFMKREFGKKLIEQLIPRWDLTHVIDTSGAYIPGHGTPTVILLGRNRSPVADTVRAVMGIRGEPRTPEDPAKGLVWSAILEQIDRVGSESEFVSVADTGRSSFHRHPWSIGGGGAAELTELIENAASGELLDSLTTAIGRVTHTGSDEAYFAPLGTWRRFAVPGANIVSIVEGDVIRDWTLRPETESLFPYDHDLNATLDSTHPVCRRLWPYKSFLKIRREPNGTHEEIGLTWYEWSRFQRERFVVPLSIAFAEVATHNHFVLDRGGKVFKQTAPVIKLPPEASEDDHLALLGLLNSSVACFWMRQVCHCKGSTVDERGARQRTAPFEDFYQYNGTKLHQFPVAQGVSLPLISALDACGRMVGTFSPGIFLSRRLPTRAGLNEAREEVEARHGLMIALQEELDWDCYRLYGLLDGEEPLTLPIDAVPGIRLGERAFEIVMARQIAVGTLETTWFERHGSAPITEIPAHWPEPYRRLVERRMQAIESNPYIRLIEQPEYKRRWNTEPWEAQQERALRAWLLDRLESPRYWPAVELTTCARLADVARHDAEFMQVAELYRGRADFEVAALVTELVGSEAVPFLPVLRYKPTGLRKRELWERTWEMQREEDRRALGVGRLAQGAAPHTARPTPNDSIPVPPKYTSTDFLDSAYWRLRGKLDVPKERFVSYPHAEREADPSLVVAWAGWDHLQQAQALAAYYVQMKENEGWPVERLTPLLAGLLELLPWLKQWHNAIDPQYGTGMGDYFADFLSEELRALDLTEQTARAWQPAAGTRRSRAKRGES